MIGYGARVSTTSGSADVSDKWNSVAVAATTGGSITTKTDSDTGQHFEYQLNTAQVLWSNKWRAQTGSGTGKGSGWAYLTTDTSGTATVTIATPSDPLELYRWGRISPAEKQLTQTIKGDSSDKLDYKYDDKFTLTKTGWANSETGSGTWNKSSHYESSVSGSVSETATGQFGLFSHTYSWGTNLKFQASISTDQEIIRDSNSTATFNWNNDGWTVTEKTTTSSKSHNSTDSDYNAQLWLNYGNVGAGNGTSETANMSWASTYKHDVTESSETTQSLTTGKGGVVWNAKYTSSEKEVTTSSLDEVRHSEQVSTARTAKFQQAAVFDEGRSGPEQRSNSGKPIRMSFAQTDDSCTAPDHTSSGRQVFQALSKAPNLMAA